MRSWLSWRKTSPEKAEEQLPASAVSNVQAEPVRFKPLDMDIQASPSDEPDYSGLADLHFNEQERKLDCSSVLVVGLGAFGNTVLRSLARRIPVDKTGVRPIRLLGISLKNEPVPDYPLPEINETLLETELIELPVSRTTTIYDWYKLPAQVWARPTGRLAVFQNLNAKPSLWEVLQPYLEVNNQKQDVWIIGTAFGSASGMLWDLAHLIQRISERQGQPPFLGCLLALPNDKWADRHMAEAAAVLRELEHRLRNNTSCKYEYVPDSDNRDLREAILRSDDDISSLILCEPDGELYGEDASADLINKISLALYTISQKAFWNGQIDARSFLRAGKQTIQNREEVCVSAFGISAHVAPISALKQLGRCVIAENIFFNRSRGILANWQNQIDFPEEDVRQFLSNCQHPLLVLIANIRTSFDHPPDWPKSSNADEILAHHLWIRFGDFLKDEDDGIAHCRAFLSALIMFFEKIDVQAGSVTDICEMLSNANNEIQAWLSTLVKIRETAQAKINHSENNLKSLLQNELDQVVFRKEAIDEIVKLLKNDSVLVNNLKENIRFAWMRNGNQLKLVLDALQPGWGKEGNDYRFSAPTIRLDDLWKAIIKIVSAYTQDDRYWPIQLTDPKNSLPENSVALEKTRSTLTFDAGQMPAGLGKATLSVQASGDQDWRKKAWFPQVQGPQRLDIFSPNFGVLINLYQSIPPSTVPLIQKLHEKFLLGNNSAKTAYVFFTEQTGAELEKSAFDKLTIRQRRDLRGKTFRLSHYSLDLMEDNMSWIELFINIWGNEFVVNKENRTSIISTDHLTSLWDTEYQKYPLDLLVEFLKAESDQREQVRQVLDAQLKTMPAVNDRQLAQISDWWQNDQKNLDWFIMANGFAKRRSIYEK